MKYLISVLVFLSSISTFAITCYVGDTGVGTANQAAVAQLIKTRCHEVFHLGDIIYPSGLSSVDDPNFQSRFWKYYGEMITQGVPFYMSVGNHDYQQKPAVWIDLAKKYPGIYMPALYYRIDRNGICHVVLDTNKLDSAQGDFIDSELNTMKSCRLKIATGHHPYWSSGPHGDTGSRKKFYEKHIIGKFNAFITGHDHVLSYEGEAAGTHLFVSGASASVTKVVKKLVYAEAKLGILESDGSEFRFVDTTGTVRFRTVVAPK